MEYGLIGEKLTHSYSKIIHGYLYKESYNLLEIKREDLKLFLENRNFKGINVTIPYKQEAIKYLDNLSNIAKIIGVINTVVNKNGFLHGYNTDYFGFLETLKVNNISLNNKNVLIIGKGGTAKTVSEVSKNQNAKNVSFAYKKNGNMSICESDYISFLGFDVVINTTPVGMFPKIEEKPISLSKFSNLEAVIDCIYNPQNTKLLEEAKSLNVKSVNGLYMLVSQATKSAELFKNIEYQKTTVDKIYNILKGKNEEI